MHLGSDLLHFLLRDLQDRQARGAVLEPDSRSACMANVTEVGTEMRTQILTHAPKVACIVRRGSLSQTAEYITGTLAAAFAAFAAAPPLRDIRCKP